MATNTKPQSKTVVKKSTVRKSPAPVSKAKATTAQVVAPATEKAPEAKTKVKKIKQVRDSFTMPKDEYEQIATLKMNLAKQGRPTKKSELLRAGLLMLCKQTPGALLACVEALTPIKTGRPRKD